MLDRSCPRGSREVAETEQEDGAAAGAIRASALGIWRARCRVGWNV